MIAALRKRPGFPVILALVVVLLAGAGLRFFQIGSQPLWLDEAFSVWMSRQPIPEIVRLTIDIDQHPPLYHLLLHLWTGLGGTGEVWVRSLSALLGVLAILVIFFTGRALGGPLMGLLAALLLAFSPFHVQYAQESRSYTLLTLCAAVVMWMTVRLLNDPCCHTQRIGQQLWAALRSRRFWPVQTLQTDLAWLAYALFTALSMYVHNTAVFLPLGINVFVLGLILHRRLVPAEAGQFQAPSLFNWAAAQVGAFLIWSPWLQPFYEQSQSVYGEFWIPRPTREIVINTLKTFLMAWLPERLAWGWLVWVAFGALFVLALVRFRRSPGRFLLLAALFLVPFGGELLVSLWRPIFYDRTLIWSTIPLYLLAAAGISQLRYRSYIVTAAVILVTMSWLSISVYYEYAEKERWDQAAAYVAENVQEGDIILFNAGWTQLPFDYYFSRYNKPVELFGAPATLFETGELEPRMTREDLPRLQSIITGRPRVWLVYSHNWWTDPQALVPAELRKELRLNTVKLFNGLQVQLYERR